MAIRVKDLSVKSKGNATTNDVLLVVNKKTGSNSQFALTDIFPKLQNGKAVSSSALGSALGVNPATMFVGGGYASSVTGSENNTLIFKGFRLSTASSPLSIKEETDTGDVLKGNIVLGWDASSYELSNFSNTSTGFLTSVNLSNNVTNTLPVANGGTGVASLTDKAVLITQDSGTDTVASVAMSTNGQILVGGTSGPAVTTLTGGTNVTVTNSDGGISIASSIGTIGSTLNMSNNKLQMGTGFITGDGADEGILLDSTGKVFIGSSTPTSYQADDLNVNSSITLGATNGTTSQNIRMRSTTTGSSPSLSILGATTTVSGQAGGNLDIKAGNGSGGGNGGTLRLYGGLDGGSGTDGSIAFYTANTLMLTIGPTGISTFGADMTIGGATPTLTIGDGGTEDTSLVFDGNAQDYYVGLDDTDDTLKIGLGSAVGTTPAISVDSALNTSLGGHAIITAATDGLVHTGSGTVTQASNHTTAVTINATSGVIQLAAVALNAATNAEFTVTNSTVQADSVIILTVQDENTTNNAQLTACTHTIAGGSFKISVFNPAATGATSTTASKIHFLVINNSV